MAQTGSRDASAGDHKDDLSTILSTEECVELTLLIANASELMRKKISDTFDASIMKGQPPQQVLRVTDKNPNVDDTRSKAETEEDKRARELRERREKELSAPNMLQLKKDSLEFFDKWRESVHSRLGALVNNSKELVEEQTQKASSVERTPDSTTREPKVLRKTLVEAYSISNLGSVADSFFSGPNTNIEESDAALIELCPPISTSLYSLPKDKRILLLHSMLLLLLSLEHYIAHSRVLLLHIASSLHLPLHILSEQEVKVAQGLLEAAKQMSGNEETQKRGDENKVARRWKVGLAGVAGAAIIGVTGGLAAPLVAGAIGTVMG